MTEVATANLDPMSIAPVTDADHVLGPIDAPITLVEYGEFECPHCGRAHHQLKALRERLDDLGARFVFRHFARDEVHPFAVRAAVTAEAAAFQGRFWEMHDHLFEHQHQLEHDDLKRHANEVGLDIDRFMTDVRDGRALEVVTAHNLEAVRSGIDETPAFFIDGVRYDGPYDLDSLVTAIQG